MSEEKKEVRTPATKIISRHFNGRVTLLEPPVNEHYCIVELPGLPEELGFPDASPRTYVVSGVPKSGAHAHKEGTESEIMVCLHGAATVHVWDEGGHHEEFVLTPPQPGEKFRALFIKAGVWHTVRYSPGTILMVIASCVYDRSYYEENPEDYFKGADDALARYHEVFDELD